MKFMITKLALIKYLDCEKHIDIYWQDMMLKHFNVQFCIICLQLVIF